MSGLAASRRSDERGVTKAVDVSEAISEPFQKMGCLETDSLLISLDTLDERALGFDFSVSPLREWNVGSTVWSSRMVPSSDHPRSSGIGIAGTSAMVIIDLDRTAV
jgi:hypothetical protein